MMQVPAETSRGWLVAGLSCGVADEPEPLLVVPQVVGGASPYTNGDPSRRCVQAQLKKLLPFLWQQYEFQL